MNSNLRSSSSDSMIIKRGKLDILVGCMCSGKTTELLRRLTTAAMIGMKVLYVNHSLDDRNISEFSTHNPLYNPENSKELNNIKYIKTSSLTSINLKVLDEFDYDMIGIDEAQFFTDLFSFVCDAVDIHKKHVIIAGLDGDRNRRKFGQILDLIPLSDSIVKLQPYCKPCGKKQEPAIFTLYIGEKPQNEFQNIIGGMEKYIPVCRECYLNYQG